ncbi:hypothetical protein CT676_21980 [Bradyrhizobium sp. MOS001]|nr:hypothetical protein CT676_21980 [Bradyrhizobium sp. MOS001]
MERSEIRDSCRRQDRPGLRCAPSGLRASPRTRGEAKEFGSSVGWAKAHRAVPTIFQQLRRERWARFRLRSSSYGGQVALPALRQLSWSTLPHTAPCASTYSAYTEWLLAI